MSYNHKLSILIPTLIGREEKLHSLIDKINRSYSRDPMDYQIVVASDNRELTTGSKRQQLLWTARGEYCCFVDDDDDICDDYVNIIMTHLERNPDVDCCSLKGQITFSDGYSRIFEHSLKYDRWIDDHKQKIYFRPPNHLNTIKTELARKAGFPSLTVGEDRVFSQKIRPMLKTEAEIDWILYYYNARGTFEEIHRGLSRDYEGVSG